MDDSEIIRLFTERSERALAEVQDKYCRYCMAIAMNILGDREKTENCVNEAFHTAWQLIPPNTSYTIRTGDLNRLRRLSLRSDGVSQKEHRIF